MAEGTSSRPVVVRERADDSGLLVHPGWREAWPWLVQGTTTRRFHAAARAGGDGATWKRMAGLTGCPHIVRGRQAHGAQVARHGAGPPGVFAADNVDGHATCEPGVLLTVSVGDCVPVSLVDPGQRIAALLHAGWRGIAAGILEAGLEAVEALDSVPENLYVHLGPAVCAGCYEVGPEVHAALGLPAPEVPAPVDLRAVLAQRAVGLGVPGAHLTVSRFCTRCDDGFYSHRAGDTGRQVGFLGMGAAL